MKYKIFHLKNCNTILILYRIIYSEYDSDGELPLLYLRCLIKENRDEKSWEEWRKSPALLSAECAQRILIKADQVMLWFDFLFLDYLPKRFFAVVAFVEAYG